MEGDKAMSEELLNYLSYKPRVFATGATRDTDVSKPDYEGFISPLVLQRFGEYMNQKRTMPDGSRRESDNWQKGIPINEYVKSHYRHFVDLLLLHDGYQEKSLADMETTLCAILFNTMGHLHEVLKAKRA